MSSEEKKRRWGASEIRGGRHLFRLRLMLEAGEKLRPAPARVLDAGCGDGSLALTLLARGYSVAAVDASAACLDRLSAKLHSLPTSSRVAGAPTRESSSSFRPRDRVNFPLVSCQASLGALPFADSSFDLVFSGEVLEHLAEDAAAVRELFRVLTPGGLAIVTVPAHRSLWGLEDEWAGHLRRYELPDLKSLFENAGFATVRIHYWGWPLTYYYNRYLFRFWLQRKIKKGDADLQASGAISGHPWLARAMAAVFSLDRFFLNARKGLGLLGVFQKEGASARPHSTEGR